MSVIEARLAELGHTLPEVPAPIAAYVPATQTGTLVFTSGQLPTVDGKLLAEGIVGNGEGDIDVETAKKCAERSGLNALAAVKSVIGDLDKVVRIVKVTGLSLAAQTSLTIQQSLMVQVNCSKKSLAMLVCTLALRLACLPYLWALQPKLNWLCRFGHKAPEKFLLVSTSLILKMRFKEN